MQSLWRAHDQEVAHHQKLHHGISRSTCCTLEKLCASDLHAPTKPRLLDEVPFTRDELKHADKACDEVGLVARTSTLQLFFQLRRFHVLPVTIVQPCSTIWRRAIQMEPHIVYDVADVVAGEEHTDFRPIANVRVLYKLFAYMVIANIEDTLDNAQGFRKHRRIEEHLLTARYVVDKTEAANLPVWIVSLGLSKAFDRIDWDMLWEALADQGISAHLRSSNVALYCDLQGQLVRQFGHRRDFNIHAGVRQGCC